MGMCVLYWQSHGQPIMAAVNLLLSAAVLLCSDTFISIVDNLADTFNFAVMVNGICIGYKGVFLSFSTYKLCKTIRSCHCVAER